VVARIIEPAESPCASQREPDDEDDASEAGHCQQKLPTKKLQTVATVASPSLANVALLSDYTVKQNEAHYAADVKKQKK
jgi:hypothetical protein